jgi:hypothetical protein
LRNAPAVLLRKSCHYGISCAGIDADSGQRPRQLTGLGNLCLRTLPKPFFCLARPGKKAFRQ